MPTNSSQSSNDDNTIIRLQLSFLFMIALILLIAFIGAYNVSLINNHMKVITENIQSKLSLTTTMRTNARERTLSLQIMVLTDDPFLRDEHWMLFNQYGAKFAEARLKLLKLATSENEISILEQQRDVTKEVIPFQLQVADLATNEEIEKAKSLLIENALPLQNDVFSVIDQLYFYYDKQLKQEKSMAQSAYRNVIQVSIIAGTVSVLVAFITATWITKRIRKYQNNLNNMNQDLETRVEMKTLALKGAELRQKNIIQNAIEGILTLNDKQIIQSVNPAALKIFKFKEHELIGIQLDKLMLKPDSQDNKGGQHFNVKEHISKEIELLGQRKDGSRLPLLVGFSINPSDMAFHYSCFIRDITEQKRVEKLKNEFVSTVSHELRTPLTSIRGSLGLILGGAVGKLPDKIHSLLILADNNVTRLLALINDLLDIQKIESGMMSFKLDKHDIIPVLDQTLHDNMGYAKQFNVNLEFNHHLNSAIVMIDPARIAQVATNLISNAIKFSHPNETVTLSIEEVDEYYKIRIIDRGIGISEEFKNKLFDKFTQEDSSSTRSKGGTGLGLNIVKVILENHNSDLQYDSSINKGSTFYFLLKKIV